MPLRVNYTMKSRIGYYRKQNRNVWLCSSNSLWAEIHFYAEPEDGKRVQKVQLISFLADVEHLKRCLKAGILKYQGLTFFADKMTPELWKAVKELTQNGIKVTIK